MTPVPLEKFMDYVPDTAGFKLLNYKKADPYLGNVRPLHHSHITLLIFLYRAGSSGQRHSTSMSSKP